LISCSLSCLLLISCLMGLLSGVINILLNLLFCHYIGSDKAALAFGLSSFLSGIATLARPLVVGYFRDSPTNGSYNGLLMSLGVFCVCTGFLWFLEPLLMRKQNEPKNASVMTLATSTSSLATTTESTLRLKESIDDNRTCIHRQL
jgi:MFS family permease